MTGLEVIFLLTAALGPIVISVPVALLIMERKKRSFVRALARALPDGAALRDVHSGDERVPLTFVVDQAHGHLRVSAVRRGDVEVWHVVREAPAHTSALDAHAIAVIERGWRAPEGERLPELEPQPLDAGARLAVHAEGPVAAGVVDKLRELLPALTAQTRVCVLRAGRAFVEISRHGLDAKELVAALSRIDAALCVFADLRRVPALPASSAMEHAPDGAPIAVPLLVGRR